jgi:hypothetical protein
VRTSTNPTGPKINEYVNLSDPEVCGTRIDDLKK